MIEIGWSIIGIIIFSWVVIQVVSFLGPALGPLLATLGALYMLGVVVAGFIVLGRQSKKTGRR